MAQKGAANGCPKSFSPPRTFGFCSAKLKKKPPAWATIFPKVYFWCQIADVFLTANLANIDNYKLQALVKQFNLAGDLF